MTDSTGTTNPTRTAAHAVDPIAGRSLGIRYRITVKGAVDEAWTDWFDGLRITHAGADTVLDGTVRDQAALHGLLARIRDLGLTLLAVEPAAAEAGAAHAGEASPARAQALAASSAAPRRSPVVAVLAAISAGAVLAVASVLAIVVAAPPSSSEATITGAILLALGAGWGLMAYLSKRFTSAPQRWAAVPALAFGLVGIGLVAIQPGPVAIDRLGWIWPPALAILAVWVVLRSREALPGRGRWLVYALALALLGTAAGGAVTSTTAAIAKAAMPADGRLVDIGGHRLYLECHGTGGPVVVLEAGLGGTAADWSTVAGSVEGSTTVCAYDRAGHGWSDEADGPQDGVAIAADLHELLARAGVAGPYILVGHSSGGPYVRVFASLYPDEVAGMVLVDAQPSDPFASLPDYPGFYGPYRAAMDLAPSLSRLGVGLLLGTPADPAGVHAARSTRDEVRALPDALAQARALVSIGDRPLVVVTAAADQQAGWLEAQDELVGMSTNHAHRVIATATHSSIILGAEAPASVQAILDVVAAARTGTAVR